MDDHASLAGCSAVRFLIGPLAALCADSRGCVRGLASGVQTAAAACDLARIGTLPEDVVADRLAPGGPRMTHKTVSTVSARGELTDQQLHDMFAVARVDKRSRNPGTSEPPATAQIERRPEDWARCSLFSSTLAPQRTP